MRLILADDATVIRRALARLLDDEGFDVIAEVGDGSDLIRAVTADPPDAVLVDIRMPPSFSTEGLRAAHTIRQQHPHIGVLVLSQHIDVAYATQLLAERPQHTGYLLKDRIADVATLTSALTRVHAGETVVDPALVAELIDAPRRKDPLAALTEREREVLALVAEGRTDRGIGETLWITSKTVESHVRSIFRKLDIPTAAGENRRVHAVLTFLQTR